MSRRPHVSRPQEDTRSRARALAAARERIRSARSSAILATCRWIEAEGTDDEAGTLEAMDRADRELNAACELHERVERGSGNRARIPRTSSLSPEETIVDTKGCAGSGHPHPSAPDTPIRHVRPTETRPALWAPRGFAAVTTAALDPPLSAAPPAVPALLPGPGPRRCRRRPRRGPRNREVLTEGRPSRGQTGRTQPNYFACMLHICYQHLHKES